MQKYEVTNLLFLTPYLGKTSLRSMYKIQSHSRNSDMNCRIIEAGKDLHDQVQPFDQMSS